MSFCLDLSACKKRRNPHKNVKRTKKKSPKRFVWRLLAVIFRLVWSIFCCQSNWLAKAQSFQCLTKQLPAASQQQVGIKTCPLKKSPPFRSLLAFAMWKFHYTPPPTPANLFSCSLGMLFFSSVDSSSSFVVFFPSFFCGRFTVPLSQLSGKERVISHATRGLAESSLEI